MPKLSIKLDSFGPFAAGDKVTGAVVLESNKSYEVQNVDLILRCLETATEDVLLPKDHGGFNSVTFGNNFPSDYALKAEFEMVYVTIFNKTRHCSVRHTLFPANKAAVVVEPYVEWSSEDPEPFNKNAERYERDYTLQAGRLELPFGVKIPHDVPPTLQTTNLNSILWTLNVELNRKSMFTFNHSFQQVIPVYQHQYLQFDSRNVVSDSMEKAIKVYLPGYKDSMKTLSGFFHNLSHKENEFKTNTTVRLKLFRPADGILQLSHPIAVTMALEGQNLNLDVLEIHACKVSLLQRVDVQIKARQHLETNYSQWFPLLDRKHIHASAHDALKALNLEMSTLIIDKPLTETFSAKYLSASYTLRLEVVISSRERPQTRTNLLVDTPVILHSCKATVKKVP